jgi:hypothetical protein
MQVFHGIRKRLFGRFMQVGDGNSTRETGVIGVGYGIGCSDFSGEIVQLGGCDTIINALNNAHGHLHWIYRFVKLIAKLFNSSSDFVELNKFFTVVSLYNIHGLEIV